MSKSELTFLETCIDSGLTVTVNGTHVTCGKGSETVAHKRALVGAMKPTEAEALARATAAVL